jgi:ribosomal protein S24E
MASTKKKAGEKVSVREEVKKAPGKAHSRVSAVTYNNKETADHLEETAAAIERKPAATPAPLNSGFG